MAIVSLFILKCTKSVFYWGLLWTPLGELTSYEFTMLLELDPAVNPSNSLVVHDMSTSVFDTTPLLLCEQIGKIIPDIQKNLVNFQAIMTKHTHTMFEEPFNGCPSNGESSSNMPC